jgi:hypothetical protein
VSESLLIVTARLGQTACQAALVASFQFIVEQQGQELHRSKLPFDGLSGSEVEGFQHP